MQAQPQGHASRFVESAPVATTSTRQKGPAQDSQAGPRSLCAKERPQQLGKKATALHPNMESHCKLQERS